MTAGVALAPAAGAQTPPSTDASLRSLSFESDLRQTRMFPAFDPAVDRYDVAVPSGETEVTVKVATNHSGASVVLESTREGRCCIEELDYDANTDAYTLQLRTDRDTYMTVKVTAEDGSTTREYVVYVDVASSDALGWRVYNDVPMDRLVDDLLLPSHYVHGVWADGSRVLTTAERHGSIEGEFNFDQKLYAFDAADSSRQTAEEFVLGGRPNAGIWSDGTTLWAMSTDGTLNAYSLSGGEGERETRVHDDGSAHVTALPLEGKSTDVRPSGYYDTGDMDAPRGIWSNGDTLWVVDRDSAKVVAFALPGENCANSNNYCRRPLWDFDLDADNDEPWGITAGRSTPGGDVDTWWVTNVTDDRARDKKLYAYVYSEDSDTNGTRNSDLDIDLKDTLKLGSYQQFFYGLAATDTIMYVAEFITGRVYSFSMPGVEGPVAPALVDTTLTGLSLRPHMATDDTVLDPVFSPEHFYYTANVEPDDESITVTATPNPSASAVVRVDGTIAPNGVVALNEGINEIAGVTTIEIGVTAEDDSGQTYKQTYTVVVNRRAKSTDATLSGLELSGVLPEDLRFASSTEDYDLDVANGLESTTVTATASIEASTVTITLGSETTTSRTMATLPVDLAEGDNVIEVLVTAEDPSVTKTYRVTVDRDDPPPSTDATLDNLELSGVTLDQTFSSMTDEYTASVAHGVASTTVTPTLNDSAASYAILLDDVADDDEIDLAVGANVIKVVVTAEDTSTTKTYKVTVTRAQKPISTDATLSGLVLSGATLDPTFSAAETEYTALVAHGVASTTVTPTLNSSAASYAILLDDVADDDEIDLAVGANVIKVVVTAEDTSTTKTYKVTVTRAQKPISTDATLSGLVLSGATLDPTFSAAETEYTALVANSVASTTVTPTLNSSAASYAILLDDVADDDEIDLAVGANVIKVVVTAEDTSTTKTYKVTVTREARSKSTDATLDMLVLSGVTLDPTFSAAETEYTALVANGVASTTVTPTLNHSAASYAVTLNDVDDDNEIDLAVGANVIKVTVTAEDDSTMITYKVTVTRDTKPPETDATLDNLVLSGVTLTSEFRRLHETYTASVTNGVASTTVTPTLYSSAASYAILLDDVADDEDIDLAVDANVIKVVVTAENGTDMKTYTVTVTRAAPNSQPPVNSNPGTSNPGTSNPGGGSSNPGTTTVGESSGDESESDSESDDVTPLEDVGDADTDHQADINELHGLGVFAGTLCQANRLCPNDPLARWIAAVWLVRLIDGDDPDPVTETRFADVNASTMWEESMWFAPHVERLADLEITVGCSEDPLNFCPDVMLRKAQVASWLARAFDLESDESQGFVDAEGSVHEANINAVVAAGVMEGCSTDPKNFCINDTVTKGEMASYVNKARKAASN